MGIGALAIPGLGPFIAAGPIMAALAGLGAGAAVGGVGGALVGFGIPEYEAKRYEGRVKGGAYLISVHSDNSEWADRAEAILEGDRRGGHILYVRNRPRTSPPRRSLFAASPERNS